MADVKAVIHSDSVKANISTPVLNAKVYRATLPGGSGGKEVEIGCGLKLEDNVLSVDTADKVEQDNSKPVTSAAVYTVVGNINAILESL